MNVQFAMKIACDNAAFGDDFDAPELALELARILREVADKIETGRACGPCRDINGNLVGSFGLVAKTN